MLERRVAGAVAGRQQLGQGLVKHLAERDLIGVVDRERRVEVELERVGAQQPEGEGVDGLDPQPIDGGEQSSGAPRPLLSLGRKGLGREPARRPGLAMRVGALVRHRRQLALKAVGHLRCRGVGEGDRDDPLEHRAGDVVVAGGAPTDRSLRFLLDLLRRREVPPDAHRPGEQARDERGRLAGAGAGLEHHGGVEAGLCAPPRRRVELERGSGHGVSPLGSGSAASTSSASARSAADVLSGPRVRRSSVHSRSRRRAPLSPCRQASATWQ